MSSTNTSTLGTAVVTGASSGIGKVYADRLAARGYDLLLIARRGDRLKAIGEDLESRYPVRVKSLVADLADPTGLAETVKTLATASSITLLVNNAGTSATGQLAEASQETLVSMVALNITALSALTIAVLPGFLERDSGTIINIGSVVGYGPFDWVPIYGPTKAYVLNFTQILQKQVAETGVRVQLVTPAATVSDIWESVGIPLSELDPATVMTTDHLVDAALRGLDDGELITAPPLHDESVLRNFEAAADALLAATQITGKPAPRYGIEG